MAFKKTQGQKAFVSPAGMPDLSGFKQAAQTFSGLAQDAYNIGLDERKRQYNDLIRQAEIDGKTAGVTYDDDNNLVPLTNFDYGKEASLYSDAERKGVLDVYRRSAIQTYVSAASNDIRINADQALSANPNNPDAVRGALEGQLDSLNDLDSDIAASLIPKAVAEFTIAENRALAQQQKEAKDFSVQQNSDAFKANAVKLGILEAKGATAGSFPETANTNRMIEELIAEQNSIKESLRAEGLSETAITQLENVQTTVVVARTAQAQVERSMAAFGPAETYELIARLNKEAAQTEGVDSTKVTTLLNQTMTNLMAVQSSNSKAEKDFKSNVYSNLYKNIIVDGYDINEAFSDPNSDIHGLDGTQQATLFTVGNTAIQNQKDKIVQIANDEIASNKVIYDNFLANIKAPDVVGQDSIRESMREIGGLALQGKLGPEGHRLLVEAKAEFTKAENFFLSQSAQKAGSYLQVELGAMSSFARSPSYYLNEMYISGLESKGIIGQYFSTRKEFINAVEAYDALWTKRDSDLRLANKAEQKAVNNIMPDADEMRALVEVRGFDKVFVDGQQVELNLLSEDEAVFQASADAVAAFAVTTDGLLHPEAKVIFDNAMNTTYNADRAMRLMGQTMTAIRSSRKDGEPREVVEARFFKNFDNMDTIQFLRSADRVGIENATKAFSTGPNMNRGAGEVVANSKFGGEDFDTIFEDAFGRAVQAKGFFKFFQPMITDTDNQMLYQMANEAGVGNIENAIFADPYIEDTVKRMFNNTMMRFPMAKPEEVVRDVLGQVGKRIGIEKNPDTGLPEFKQDPILRNAQATAGASGINLTQEDIDNHVKDLIFIDNPDMFNAPNMRIREELALVGTPSGIVPGGRPAPTLHYLSNETYGGKPSYTVVLKDSYGKVHELFSSFSYDFKQTKAYGMDSGKSAFDQAVSSLESSKVKRFWSAVGIMDQTQINSTFREIERARNDKSLNGLANGLVKMYNYTFGGYNLHKLDENPLTQQEVKEFVEMIDVWRQLGW